jgi:UDP-N-acetylmuramate dehydrogenase
MRGLEEFAEISRDHEPLASYTHLKLGGPAEALVQPRTREELSAILGRCTETNIPVRVLGAGCNLIVREEGVPGIVLRLCEPAFTQIAADASTVKAGAGAPLSALISESARHALTGLELLIGIPGTVGGALRCNAGDRTGEIGQYVRRVEALDNTGQLQVREHEDLRFAYRWSNLDDLVVLGAEFEMDTDHPDAIVKRMRKAWIQRKATQPLSFQAAVRMFKDPRGLSAATLIEQSGLGGTRVGGAELSERDGNAVVAQPGATTHDVLRLIDMVRSKVQERFQVELELQITIW